MRYTALRANVDRDKVEQPWRIYDEANATDRNFLLGRNKKRIYHVEMIERNISQLFKKFFQKAKIAFSCAKERDDAQ